MAEFDLCVVIDDDEDILTASRLLLRALFAEVLTATDPADAIAALGARSPDVVLLDANFARGATNSAEGLVWLDRLLAIDPEMIVILITAHAGVQIAVEAMKRGAADFVAKPWSNERLVAAVRTGATLRRSRHVAGRAAPAASHTLLLGSSPAMARVHSLIARADRPRPMC